MTFWLPLALLVLVVLLCWVRERGKPKEQSPSFKPWHVRLLPRSKRK